MEASVKQE